MNNEIWIEKYFSLSSHLIKKTIEKKLSMEEFLLLLYFEDAVDKSFQVENIKQSLFLEETAILNAFNSLMKKKLIEIKSEKDIEGRMKEIVSLEPFYKEIIEEKQTKQKEETKIDIYTAFETEFGRAISSIEYEIIGAWIDGGFSEELIFGALKEAVYNGVTNFRYIEKILYEWQKKGYKTMNDVNKSFTKQEEKKTESLFDYDWLDDNAD